MEQFGFEIVRDLHFAGGDLVWSCAYKTKFAMAQAFGVVVGSGAHGRAEDAAGHGTPCVHIAAAGYGIERGTCGFVGEVVKFFLILDGLSECAGFTIAGETCAVFLEPCAGAVFDPLRRLRVCCMQCFHSGAEADGVERVDGEGSVTALRAADAAGKKCSGVAGGFGERSIHDLHEFGIARGKGHEESIIAR